MLFLHKNLTDYSDGDPCPSKGLRSELRCSNTLNFSERIRTQVATAKKLVSLFSRTLSSSERKPTIRKTHVCSTFGRLQPEMVQKCKIVNVWRA